MITLEYKEEWLEYGITAWIGYDKNIDQIIFRARMREDEDDSIMQCQYAVTKFELTRKGDVNRLLNEAFQRVVAKMIREFAHKDKLSEGLIDKLTNNIMLTAGPALRLDASEIRYHIVSNQGLLWESGRITKQGEDRLVGQVVRELMRHSVYADRPDLTYDDSFDIRLEDMPESMRERVKESIVDGFNTYARFATANLNGMPVAIKSGSVSFEPPDDVEPTIISDIADRLAGNGRHKAIGTGG